MNIVKRTLAIAAILLASFSASATLMNVGGVEWDPDHSGDFKGVTGVIYQEVDLGTGDLSGYGRLTSLNGLGMGDLCPGCELTFHFGGFLEADDPATTNITEYKAGWMNFWVDNTPDAPEADADLLTLGNTGDDGGVNDLWLSLEGHHYKGLDTTFSGGLLDGIAIGLGYLDVTGGLAAWHINTNTVLTPNGTLADIRFASTFTDFEVGLTKLSGTGSANFKGDSIPEPTSLGIFGLGLIALAIGVRTKRV